MRMFGSSTPRRAGATRSDESLHNTMGESTICQRWRNTLAFRAIQFGIVFTCADLIWKRADACLNLGDLAQSDKVTATFVEAAIRSIVQSAESGTVSPASHSRRPCLEPERSMERGEENRKDCAGGDREPGEPSSIRSPDPEGRLDLSPSPERAR